MTLESFEGELGRTGNPPPGTATLVIFQAFAPGTRLCALLPQLADILKTKPSGEFSWVPGGALGEQRSQESVLKEIG